jgi:hypothetical protein
MKTEKSTKILLLAIALGLWANALGPLFRPTAVKAQNDDIVRQLKKIESNVDSIAGGICLNSKIC